MADTIAIKRRIRSVSSTRQITRAQQLVAASKLRAATAAAVSAQTYTATIKVALEHAATSDDWANHPLVQANDSTVTRIVVIGSDRGLAGAYHSRLEATLRQTVEQYSATGEVEIETIGRKAAAMAARIPDIKIAERHAGVGVLPSVWEVANTAQRLVQAYADGTIGRIVVIATQFYSPLRQEAQATSILPLGTITPATGVPVTLEPDAESAIAATVQNWAQAVMYNALANALASEQAMRMLAMENATNNANDMIDDLTLAYNNARQAAITQQLAEISGGVAALS